MAVTVEVVEGLECGWGVPQNPEWDLGLEAMALWVLLGPLHGHADADQGSSHSQNLLCHPDNDSGSTEASGPLHAFSMCYLSLWLFVFIYLFMSTIFTSLINRCLGMFILGFSLYGILCTSWT